jgi:hypothetical protein
MSAEKRVTGVRYVADYTISVTFADGFQREVDLSDELNGEVFEPLRDRSVFKQVRFDPDAGTAVWPNGVDLAPEFLPWGPHIPKGCPCGYDDPE